MKTFDVTITAKVHKTYRVNADTVQEAEGQAREQFTAANNGAPDIWYCQDVGSAKEVRHVPEEHTLRGIYVGMSTQLLGNGGAVVGRLLYGITGDWWQEGENDEYWKFRPDGSDRVWSISADELFPTEL